MHAVEFIADLGPEPVLAIPQAAAAQPPTAGKARIIVLPGEDLDRSAAYEQFMRDDAAEDAVYDSYR